MRDLRGSWLPSRSSLRFATFIIATLAVLVVAVELRQRTVVAAQRMTLTEVGRKLFYPGLSTSVRVVAYDDLRGRPVPDVEVTAEIVQEIAQEPRVTIAIPIVKTNELGAAQLAIEVPQATPKGRYRLQIRAEHGDDATKLNVPVVIGGGQRGAMIAVDKPRYQPGQIIHMRGLVLGPDRKPAADSDVTFSVIDSRGTLVSKQQRKTSAFGIASADLQLADKLNLGDYTVKLASVSGEQERKVKVATYSRPLFKVDIAVDGDASAGEPLLGRVRALYTFGQPVVGAKARVEGKSGAGAKVSAQGVTDEAGELRFELTSPAVISQLEAEVSGEGIGRQSAKLDVKASAGKRSEAALSVAVVSESRELVRGVDNAIYFVITDEENKPVAATLRGVATEPFTITSSELGVAKLEVEPRAFASEVDFALSAEDVLGRWGHAEQTVAVNADDGAFRLRTDRAAYAAGEAVVLSVRSALPGTLHVDMVDSQRTLASTEIEILAGRGEGKLTVPKEAAGLVELRAFRQRGPFRFSRGTQRVFVTERSGLDVDLRFALSSYRPGEKLSLDVFVRHEDKPVKAALSLAGIDDAVLRDHDAPPGSEIEQLTGGGRLVESRVTEASPSLRPLLGRTDATTKEREAQRAMLAAVDFDAQRDQQIFLSTVVHNGRGGEARRVDERWGWESDRAEMLRIAMGGVLGLGLLLLIMIMRNAWTLTERVVFEGPPRRVLRAWTRLVFGASLSTIALPAAVAQIVEWRSAVAFGVWTVLWAASGALLWDAAGHMATARSLRRLGRGICAMHLLCHGVALAAFGGLHSKVELALVMAAAVLMLAAAATAGAARVAYAAPGKMLGALTFCGQLLFVGALFIGSGYGFEQLVARYTDPLDPDRLTEREQELREVELLMEEHADNKEGGTGTRAKGEEGSMGNPNARFGAGGDADAPTQAMPLRVREFFPETWLWRPEVVTGADGKASVELQLADSITTWNVSASAVDASGNLGSASTTVRGFQDFFADVEVPSHLTVGDRVLVPVVAFNYLEAEQDIDLEMEVSEGLAVVGKKTQRLRVQPQRSASVMFTLRAKARGAQKVTVHAKGPEVADAIRRAVTVHLDEHRVVRVQNGAARGTRELSFEVPKVATDEGRGLRLKVYPGMISQVAEGLQGVFKKPYGCFEQTSSTTYPSVLALAFMRRTKYADPKLEKTALGYIGMGYQRLLSFEVTGGGFSLFGRSPAKVVLTAYGLMEFTDMAAVRPVDQQMIERTRKWLLSKQSADGRWDTKKGAIRETAYVAWALAESGLAADKLSAAMLHVASTAGLEPDDPYVLALRANALLRGGRNREAQGPIDRLLHLRDDKTKSWEATGRTLLYSSGRAADQETTALAALALLRSKRHDKEAQDALGWLATQRTRHGTWHSTAATVAVMRAMLWRDAPATVARELSVGVNGEDGGKLDVEAGSAYAMMDLADKVSDGTNNVVLSTAADADLQFQLISSYFVPWDEVPEQTTTSDFSLTVVPDRTEIAAGEEIRVDATLQWRGKQPIRMPMIEIGVPPSMDVVSEDLDALRKSGKIELWGRSARHVVLYLPILRGSQRVSLRFRSRYPAEVKMPTSRAYAYYDPDVLVEVAPIDVKVR